MERSIFPPPGKKHRSFLAVIHVDDRIRSFDEITIAFDNGADGVFLINHSIDVPELIDAYHLARTEFPKAWIGLNCLGIDVFTAVTSVLFPMDANGIWSDDSGIPSNKQRAIATWNVVSERFPRMVYFGGVAFKYQRQVVDVAGAASEACKYMDVVTTSGPATGSPPDPEKIRSMASVSTKPVAIASGMTPQNVGEYSPARAFLVATGISRDFTHLDPAKVKAMRAAIDSMP